MTTLFLVLVGAFIGWNLPQPFWAKMVQVKAQKMWQEFKSK